MSKGGLLGSIGCINTSRVNELNLRNSMHDHIRPQTTARNQMVKSARVTEVNHPQRGPKNYNNDSASFMLRNTASNADNATTTANFE